VSGANLAHVSIYSQMQAGSAVLTNAVLAGVDLTGAILAGTDLSKTAMGAVTLDKVTVATILNDANLVNANLSGTNLLGAHMTGTSLHGANLQGALLDGAYLAGAGISHVTQQANITVLDANDQQLTYPFTFTPTLWTGASTNDKTVCPNEAWGPCSDAAAWTPKAITTPQCVPDPAKKHACPRP